MTALDIMKEIDEIIADAQTPIKECYGLHGVGECTKCDSEEACKALNLQEMQVVNEELSAPAIDEELIRSSINPKATEAWDAAIEELASGEGYSDILAKLTKGIRQQNLSNYWDAFLAVLEVKPTEYVEWKNIMLPFKPEKAKEYDFVANSMLKFRKHGLIDWTGYSKDSTTWK